LGKGLLGFITEKDPALAMLKWIAHRMMLIEAEGKVAAGHTHWGVYSVPAVGPNEKKSSSRAAIGG